MVQWCTPGLHMSCDLLVYMLGVIASGGMGTPHLCGLISISSIIRAGQLAGTSRNSTISNSLQLQPFICTSDFALGEA